MSDLFADTQLRRLPVVDADVSYLATFALPEPDTVLLQRLIAEVPWRQEDIVVWGRRHAQPRLVAWYGDPGRSYTYSGITMVPLVWTSLLLDLKARVEAVAGADFNSVLLNYYRDHRDSMGLHSDDEPELGRNPVIASLSVGEARTFVMKHRTRTDLGAVRLPLASGSLLLMKGATQHHWKHGIDKLTRPCGPRVNLTFRRILADRSGRG